MTDRFTERIALAAAALALLCAGADFAARTAGGAAPLAPLAVLCAWALAVSVVVFVRASLARKAAEERREAELARTERADASMFAPGAEGEEPFSHARSLRIVERRMVPLAAPLLALALGAAAWRTARPDAAPAAVAGLLPAASLALQALVTFLLGRFLLGLARDPARRRLAGPGTALAFSALAAAVAAASELAVHGGWADAAAVAAMALAAACGVLAVESVLRAILHLYRPRGADDACVSYESALARRLVDPSSWVRGAADTLDYQFGFKFSESWLYRFFAGALAPLLIFQIAVLYAATCLVFVQADEDAVIERLGRPRAEADGGWHLGPGAHLKRPWPFETVRRFPARRILSLQLGYTPDRSPPPDTVVWTRPHYAQEDAYLVAGHDPAAATGTVAAGDAAAAAPVNLVSFNVPVEYRITNLLQYAYGHADPDGALRHAGARALTREAAGRDLFDLLGAGRAEVASALRARIAADAAALGLGVEIVFVGLPNIHPPVPVAAAFESVIGAGEEREAKVLDGKAHAARQAPLAEAQAARAAFEAGAYRERRSVLAAAETEQFLARKTASDRSPFVYRHRAQLQAIQEGLKDTRLYVVAASPDLEVLQLNLEEKPSAGLFDLGPKPEPPEK